MLGRCGGLAVVACCEPCWGEVLGRGRIEVPVARVHEGAAMACNVQVEREKKKEEKKKETYLAALRQSPAIAAPSCTRATVTSIRPRPNTSPQHGSQHATTANPPHRPNTAPKIGPMPFVHHGSQHAATANPPRCSNTARKTFGPMLSPFVPAPTPHHHQPTAPPQHGTQDLDRPPTSTPPQNGTLTPRHVAQHPVDPPCPFKAARTAQPPPTPTPPRHGTQHPTTRRLTADPPRRLNAARNTPPPTNSPPHQDPATADLPRHPNAARNTPPPADSPPRQANTAQPRGKRGNGAQLS
ncbi:hypothetical protein EDB85DRAFT_1894485 [Lactarius pseudohatsudake]|nr:hypothetical protein EDB85DRAFT_1894485 [Lactarius pseudohatsudake]